MKINNSSIFIKKMIIVTLILTAVQVFAEESKYTVISAKSGIGYLPKTKQNINEQCTKNDKLFCLGDNVTYLVHPPVTGANRPVKLVKIEGEFPDEIFTVLDSAAQLKKVGREQLCPQSRVCINDEVIGLLRKVNSFDEPNLNRWVTGVVRSIRSDGVFKVSITKNVLEESQVHENDSVLFLGRDIYKAIFCGVGKRCVFRSNQNYEYDGNPAIISRVYENGLAFIGQLNNDTTWRFVYTKDIGLLKDAFFVPDSQTRLADLKLQTAKERDDYIKLMREANRLLDTMIIQAADARLQQARADQKEAETIIKRSEKVLRRLQQKENKVNQAEAALAQQEQEQQQVLKKLEERRLKAQKLKNDNQP